jgi:predicted dehydrogenase
MLFLLMSTSLFEELIDASDMLLVCTPPSIHEQLVIAVLKCGKHVIVENPFTGYFGDGSPEFNCNAFPREKGLKLAMESIQRMLKVEI